MIVGFLGTGRIAAPMVEALVEGCHDILVSERSRAVSRDLAGRFAGVTVRDNRGVVEGSEVVVISLLATVAREELPDLPFRSDQRVISVMADMSLAEIADVIGETVELCITIPYPFINTGGCPLAVYPASPTLTALFGGNNTVIPVDSEAAMKPHFAASAVTSTIMKELMTVRDWLGSHAGGPAAAEKYMTALVGGYLGAMQKDGADRLGEAVGNLATAGGLNAQLLAHMEAAGTMKTLESGLDELLRR